MNIFAPSYQSLTADPLHYFAHRNNVRYLSVSRGAARHVAAAEQIVAGEFGFNNETHHLPPGFDWKNNPSHDREWQILLHKFYYLRDLALAYDYSGDEKYACKWMELLSSWIDAVEPGFLDTQVTGRRLQQWILSFHYFVKPEAAPLTADFLLTFLHSLDEQTAYLCEHLTPEGNHRTIELYGIFLVAVMFPELRRSAAYLHFARAEIMRNLRSDLLADGVQRELSSDYHHIVLKNFLRIRELAWRNAVALDPEYDILLRRAIEFSLYLHKPDGSIPAINDGDINDYRSLLKKSLRLLPDERVRFVVSRGGEGEAPQPRSRLFADSGYCVLRSDWREKPYRDARYLFFDCAQLGFGSHAHYDLLNIEFAAFGHSLIVDPGRYTYHESDDNGINWRHRFKSTAYHNTVVVDGKDQCEYHLTQPDVARPQAELLRFVCSDHFDFVRGRATSPRYPVVHERTLLFLPADYCVVIDRLQGEGDHSFDQYFHLHPRALNEVCIETGTTTVRVTSPQLLLAQPVSNGRMSIENGFFSPQYGIKHSAPVVHSAQSSANGAGAVFETLLYPFATDCPIVEMQSMPLRRNGQTLSPQQGHGLRIDVSTKEQEYDYTDYVAIVDDAVQGALSLGELDFEATLLWLRINPYGEVLALHGLNVRFVRFVGRVLQDHCAAGGSSL